MSVGHQIKEVYEHWRTYHARNSAPKLLGTSKEWKKIRDRLQQGYTVAQLCRAIDGMHVSPWHTGENPGGKKYLSLELCLRDATHVEQFLEVMSEHERRAPVLSEKTKQSLRAVESWAERGGHDDQ